MMTNEDALVAGTAVLFAIAVGWLVLMLRDRHAARLANLNMAGEHLDAHFDALERVLRSEKVSRASKDYLRRISHGFGNREIAERVAARIILANGKPPSPAKLGATDAFLAEIERLERSNPEIVEDIASVLHFAKSAMLLRFPNCDAAIQMLERPEAVRLARRPVSEIRKTSAVLSDAVGKEAVLV